MIAPATIPVVDTIIADADALRRDTVAAMKEAEALREELAHRLFAVFDVYDLTNKRFLAGRTNRAVEELEHHAASLERIAAMQKPEVIERHGKSLLLALPLGTHGQSTWIGLGAAEGIEEHILLSLAELFVDTNESRRRAAELHDESRRLSEHIASTFEEITLIYRLTQNLSIAHGSQELGVQALKWLSDVVPAEGLAIWYDASRGSELVPRSHRRASGRVARAVHRPHVS